MEQYGSGYGDQIRRTDEYGNPVRHTGTGTGGPTGGSHVTPTGEHGARVFDHDKKEHGHGGGILHRSNSSSSSSSSEDDGQGGRKKKLKDKIKDKLPGGKKQHPTTTQDAYGHGANTQDAYGHGTAATHGANTQDAYGHGTAATQDAYGHGTAATHGATTTQGPVAHGTAATHGATTTQGAYGHGAEEHEKKGIMDKIKEKLPGHH